MPNSAASLPPEVAPIDYIARWRGIIERRRAQMDAAYASSRIDNADYWARRAKSYRDALHQRMDEDPLLLRVRADSDGSTSVLDVGAGTGRHTLALAPHVGRITAVDPSEAMLGFLRADVEAQGLRNVETVLSDWMTADVEPADAVICSHVLYPIADIEPFLRKLDGSARRRVYVYLRADPLPTDMGLWPEFYGVPLQAQPVHMDLVNVLAQIGIFADVEVVEHRFTLTFASFEDAVAQVRNSLCLRDDDAASEEKLRRLLRERLIEWPGGRLGPDVESARSAIVSWPPLSRGSGAAR
ncbi:MAG: class I SAM-dependent methyltransferase [Dehalococcoidia bacterium]|nr:MAG: class I SAM-dependent methyltransferase [Dehalococcoidia bacterium]